MALLVKEDKLATKILVLQRHPDRVRLETHPVMVWLRGLQAALQRLDPDTWMQPQGALGQRAMRVLSFMYILIAIWPAVVTLLFLMLTPRRARFLQLWLHPLEIELRGFTLQADRFRHDRFREAWVVEDSASPEQMSWQLQEDPYDWGALKRTKDTPTLIVAPGEELRERYTLSLQRPGKDTVTVPHLWLSEAERLQLESALHSARDRAAARHGRGEKDVPRALRTLSQRGQERGKH